MIKGNRKARPSRIEGEMKSKCLMLEMMNTKKGWETGGTDRQLEGMTGIAAGTDGEIIIRSRIGCT